MNDIKYTIDQINIIEVIEQYITLKKRGLNHIGLCPFHSEKTPSFHVNPSRQKWKCFGCGKGGDVVDFIQLYHNKSFPEAMEALNIRHHLPIQFKRDTKPLPLPKKLNVLPPEIVQATMANYNQNNFVTGLFNLFDTEIVNKAIKTFHIGTSKFWEGATAFWYVDQETKVRQVKLMLYNANTLKRIKKEETPQIGRSKALFFGSTLLKKKGIKEPSLSACWFGENQLSRNNIKPIAIVESEKTAIIMTLFSWMDYLIARDYTWLATGGASAGQWNNSEALKVLEGRDIVLFPDLDAHDRWLELSQRLAGYNINVSDFLLKHKKSNEKDKRDIADFFLGTYKNAPLNLKPPEPTLADSELQETVEQDLFNDVNSYPSDWDELVLAPIIKEEPIIETSSDNLERHERHERLQKLSEILENMDYPEQPIILSDGYTKINDVCGFIQTHILFVKHNKGKSVEPYFSRLEDLSVILLNRGKATHKNRPPVKSDPHNDP